MLCSMQRTTEQNKKLHALLNQKGLMAHKANFILGATQGRSERSSDLTKEECKWLINHIENLDNDDARRNTMRRKIISLYRQMGYNDGERADMKRIEADVVQRWKKKLNDYSLTDLTHIIGVLETKLLPWYLKQQRNEQGKD